MLLNPQFSEAYTLRVPELHPVRKLTVTLAEAVVTVLVPPFIVALPETDQVYDSAPATGAMLYVPFVDAHPIPFPDMTPGCETRARTKRQKVADCPQLLPANTQMLYPDAPAGGGDAKVTFTLGVAL